MTAVAGRLRLEIANLAPALGPGPEGWRAELSIAPGEIVGLTGANGSGKSTLLRCIVGDVAAKAGAVLRLDGDDLSRMAPDRRARAGIAYCPQYRNVFPALTVGENLGIAGQRGGDLAVLPGNDLGFPLNRRAGLLSGGERQLLAIAMLLSHPARLFLLDEPFAGLAANHAVTAAAAIRETVQACGAAAIVVEHRTALLRTLCSRSLAMEAWRLAGSG